MNPKQEVSFKVDCIAAIPGEFTGRSSRAYEYYMDEEKHWIEGLRVKITPRR